MNLSKRRGARSMNDLPLTMADVARHSKRGSSLLNGQRTRSPKRDDNKSSTLRTGALFALFIVLFFFLLTQDLDYVSNHPATKRVASSLQFQITSAPPPRDAVPSLAKFSSLQHAFQNADIVGIYFAASWCPMSTPVTETLEKIFSYSVASADEPDGHTLDHRVLLPLGPGESVRDSTGHKNHRKNLAIVYVSSDKSEQEMKEYSRYNWINVPFDSPERSDLKRQFRTCAQSEMNELGIEPRRFEIPTLLIVDSVTQGVLSYSGADELEEYGINALDHWLQLQELTRSLEDKYLSKESAKN